MTTVGQRVADVKLQIPEVLALGEGKTTQPQPAFLRARPGRKDPGGKKGTLAGRPGAGGGGAGAKGRSL